MVKLGIHTWSGLSFISDMMSSLNIFYYLMKFACLSRCLADWQSLHEVSEVVLTLQQTETQGNTMGDVSAPNSEWYSFHIQ